MRNLRDELAYRYSPDAALRAVDILGQMRLPLPIAGEFLAGKESLHLPLHRHGITLRFGDPANRVQSDHFLNPFVRIPLGNTADFEILPGIRVGDIGAAGKLRLKFKLMAEGYDFPFEECVRSNIGSIQYVDGASVRVHKLVLDRGAVSVGAGLSKIFNRQSQADTPVQTRVFSPFYALTSGVWDQGRFLLNVPVFRDFMRACFANNILDPSDPHRVLFNQWRCPDIKRLKANCMHQSALRYERVYV